jgi:trigger factor|tara:strand:+ start:33789 stop:35174 length:1386 start_codon:yes stop_codon:yes gene_type:complete
LNITQQEELARQTKLEIELDDNDIEPYLNKGYQRVVQRVNIPGFRKGKAPRSIVEKQFGKLYLINEIAEHMVSDVTSKIIEEKELDLGGLPRISLISLDPVKFEATVPLKPLVELGDYKTITVDLPVNKVNASDVNSQIERVRESQSTWEPVSRKAKLEDILTIDFTANVEGTVFIEKNDAIIILDNQRDTIVPGFCNNLVGVSKGKSKKFQIILPEDYRAESSENDIGGKEASFEVTVTEIKERLLPEADDEFAKSVGSGHTSLKELKKSIKQELQQEFDREHDVQFENAAVTQLVEKSEITVPELLIEHELDHIMEERQQSLSRMNVELKDFLSYSGKTEEEFKDELRQSSIERLHRTYILQSFLEQEKLEVDEQQVKLRLDQLKASINPAEVKKSGIKPKELQQRIQEAEDRIRGDIQFESAVKKLSDIAKSNIKSSKTEKKKTSGKTIKSSKKGNKK